MYVNVGSVGFDVDVDQCSYVEVRFFLASLIPFVLVDVLQQVRSASVGRSVFAPMRKETTIVAYTERKRKQLRVREHPGGALGACSVPTIANT